jgi:H+/Cl- antiporter ClcA
LVAVIEVPLASIAFVVELFGAVYAPPVMLAVGVSHLMASYFRRFFHFNSGL